jgi:hypothetical protein
MDHSARNSWIVSSPLALPPTIGLFRAFLRIPMLISAFRRRFQRGSEGTFLGTPAPVPVPLLPARIHGSAGPREPSGPQTMSFGTFHQSVQLVLERCTRALGWRLGGVPMIPPPLMYEMAKAHQAERERLVSCLSKHDSVNSNWHRRVRSWFGTSRGARLLHSAALAPHSMSFRRWHSRYFYGHEHQVGERAAPP